MFPTDGNMISGSKLGFQADNGKALRLGFIAAGIDNFDRQQRQINRRIELHALPGAPPNWVAAGCADILPRPADAEACAEAEGNDRRERLVRRDNASLRLREEIILCKHHRTE